MICPKCGIELAGNSKFCTNCGHTFPQNNMVNTVNTTPVVVKPKKKNNTLLIVGIIVGVFAFIAIAVFSLILLLAVTKSVKESSIDSSSSSDFKSTEIADELFPDVEFDETIRTVTSPSGKSIDLVKNKYYIVKIDLDYYYVRAEELSKTAKHLSNNEITNLNATAKQKQSIKELIDYVDDYLGPEKEKIKEELKKKYDDSTIEFAMTHAGVDWQEQANIKALNLLAIGDYSKQELIDMMKYYGFSEEEATNAANQEGIDYYEQALRSACDYKYMMMEFDMEKTREEAKESLGYSDFTQEEIDFALKTIYDEMP